MKASLVVSLVSKFNGFCNNLIKRVYSLVHNQSLISDTTINLVKYTNLVEQISKKRTEKLVYLMVARLHEMEMVSLQ